MSILDMFKKDAGNVAYRTHSQANRLNDMGKIAEAEAKYAQAMELYLKAEKEGFANSKLITGYCILLMRVGNFEKARTLLEKLFFDSTITSDDKYYLDIDHAVCTWKLGDVDAAIAEVEEAAKNRKIGLYYNVLGAMKVERGARTGDFSDAAEFMKVAFDYDDDDISTIDNQAWLCYHTGDKAGAEKLFKKAVAKNDRYSPALTGLARLALEKGDKNAAKEYVERALAYHFPTTAPLTKKYAEDLKKSIG